LRFVGVSPAIAEAVFRRADLLLNFHYAIDSALLARFRRTALVDIDPGLLQYWISRGQLHVPLHDLYLTIGETVGTREARFPDCNLDAADRALLERKGWRVRHALDVAGTPERYRAYIQASRGEFSCVKPSCVEFQSAWVSDRTLCYLASGKPAVMQDTGPSAF